MLRQERRTVGKSASYTVNPAVDKSGQLFTNDGASGAITFTLPTPNFNTFGWFYDFCGVVDQSFTVQPPTNDTAIAFNDVAADSLAVSTSGQKIGACIRATCVKTTVGSYQWLLQGVAVGHTYTVAT